MKNELIVIIILIGLANFIFWSFGYSSDPGVQMKAVVPLTEKNAQATLESNLNRQTEQAEKKQPIGKENKYLQFFAKQQELDKAQKNQALSDWQANQTVYDKYASYGLMVLVMIISAGFLIIIIRLIDHAVHQQRG